MPYEWLPAGLKALRHIEPFEVTQVLAAKNRWPRPATGPDGQWVLTLWGRTETGRPLIVTVRQLSQWEWQIIGARPMTSEQITELEAQEAQR